MASTSTEIDRLINAIDNRNPEAFGSAKEADVIAKAILLHAKVIREVANELSESFDQMVFNRDRMGV